MPSLAKHFILFSFLSTFIFYSCRKSVELSFKEIKTPVRVELTGIYVWDENNIMAVGGEAWQQSIQIRSTDRGINWHVSKPYNKQIFGLSQSKFCNTVFSCGIDMVSEHNLLDSKHFFAKQYRLFRSIDAISDHEAVIVGGEAFKFGYIYHLTEQGEVRELQIFDHELDAIQRIDTNVWVISGFGLVMRSTSPLSKWDTIDIDGDHFLDLHFPSSKVGYVVGHFGTILKSIDGGLHFKKIRNGSSIAISDKAFRSVYFKDERNGIIVGDNGLGWITSDGGDSWTVIDNLPKNNYLDIYYRNSNYYLCGSNGIIIQLSDQ